MGSWGWLLVRRGIQFLEGAHACSLRVMLCGLVMPTIYYSIYVETPMLAVWLQSYCSKQLDMSSWRRWELQSCWPLSSVVNVQESELIALMDRHGIGTDASIPQHIKNICDRQDPARPVLYRHLSPVYHYSPLTNSNQMSWNSMFRFLRTRPKMNYFPFESTADFTFSVYFSLTIYV